MWAASTDQLWSHWSTHDGQSTLSVDHQVWQTLLSRHVVASDDGINRVAYKDFDESSKTLLNQYLTRLSEVQPTCLNQTEQLAYWINLYNALTVQVVLDHPTKDSIRSMGPLLSFGPWDKAYLTIEGKPVSLNDIEHRILRPIWQDHRLHFVLNCASIGCPNLSRGAYSAANVERRLRKLNEPFCSIPEQSPSTTKAFCSCPACSTGISRTSPKTSAPYWPTSRRSDPTWPRLFWSTPLARAPTSTTFTIGH